MVNTSSFPFILIPILAMKHLPVRQMCFCTVLIHVCIQFIRKVCRGLCNPLKILLMSVKFRFKMIQKLFSDYQNQLLVQSIFNILLLRSTCQCILYLVDNHMFWSYAEIFRIVSTNFSKYYTRSDNHIHSTSLDISN